MLTNPRYPDGFRNGTECNYYIRKSHHQVTQLRVEFIYFSVAPPTGGKYEIISYFLYVITHSPRLYDQF